MHGIHSDKPSFRRFDAIKVSYVPPAVNASCRASDISHFRFSVGCGMLLATMRPAWFAHLQLLACSAHPVTP
jgi:hypothetical protein